MKWTPERDLFGLYLAEYWLDAGGSASDFIRLADELAEMIGG